MSNENAAKSRTLSVNNRLATLGVAAFLGFGAMLAAGWYGGVAVRSASQQAIVIGNQVDDLQGMRLANIDLVLVAMDSIIDREERAIQPERLENITKSLKTLKDGAANARELAIEIGQTALLDTFESDLQQLEKAISVDLRKMIEEGAPIEAFAAIDDAIDEGGGRMTTTLGTLAAEGSKLLETRVNDAQLASVESIRYQIGLGLFGMATMLGLLVYHGNMLRRGIFAVRDSMRRILSGDLDTAVEATERGDEIGEMARSAEAFWNGRARRPANSSRQSGVTARRLPPRTSARCALPSRHLAAGSTAFRKAT